MSSARLAGIDAAYLAAELPGNYLHLMAILRLDPTSLPGGYRFEALRAFVEEHLPEIPPLRRRLVEVPFGIDRPRWVEVDDLDLDLHIRRAAVPSPGGARELAAMASEISDRPLDRSRPLWEITVVEGLANGEVALIAKLHHAMTDGLVGVRYMAALLGTEASEPGKPAPPQPAEPAPSELRLLAEAVPEVLSRPLRVVRATGRTLYALASSRVARLWNRAPEPVAAAAAVPWTLFNQRTGSHRTLAFTSVPLARVKAVGSACDATVNDVVLALVAGAARDYLISRNALPAESLVAGIPASTHREGDELANSYTLLFPTLATDRADPVERLCAIRDSAAREKSGRRPAGGEDLVSEWVDIPPPWLYGVLARLYVDGHFIERLSHPFFNLLVSSVPGPAVPLHFAGARITGIHPLGPIYDGLLLNVTAIGGAEAVDIGLMACRRGVADVWEFAEAMEGALADLESALAARLRRDASPSLAATHATS